MAGMARTIHHLGLLLLFLLSAANGAHVPVAKSDERALRAFLSGVESDPNGVLDSWRTATDVCAWEGVTCSRVHKSREFRVVGLRIPNSRLRGTLSSDLGLLSELKSLDLSDNEFSGTIPRELFQLPKLRFINLSNNLLVGEVPRSRVSGAFKEEAWFMGNPGLCGFPLQRKCSPFPSVPLLLSRVKKSLGLWKPEFRGIQRRLLADVPAPAPSESRATSSQFAPAPSPIRSPHKRRNKLKRWGIGAAFGILAGSIAGIIVGAIGRIGILIYKNSRKVTGPIIFYHKIKPKMLSFLDSPDCFQEMAMVGEGAAGKVYRANLQLSSSDDGGTMLTVAIKRVPIKPPPETESGKESGASNKSSFGKKHTLAEMETLGKIRHNNLAWLFAYVRKPDAHLLVYEFMHGGSLRDVLLKVKEGAMELDWTTRRKIAIGAVNGLKYLHFDCTPTILHRDLKTSNILLDEEFEAHLGDFGLAKALPDGMTHITTQVAGTFGYIAPEYALTLKLTAASDVYSMGIVIGALLCGKEPTDNFFKDQPMDAWLSLLVQTGQELKGIDSRLINSPVADGSGGGGGEALNVDEIAEMKLMMRVAYLCTKHVPADRPSSKDVLAMLNPSRIELRRPVDELINDV